MLNVRKLLSSKGASESEVKIGSRGYRQQIIVFALVFALIGGYFIYQSFAAGLPYKTVDFTSKPAGWKGLNNRPGPGSPACLDNRTNSFGWQDSTQSARIYVLGDELAAGADKAGLSDKLKDKKWRVNQVDGVEGRSAEQLQAANSFDKTQLALAGTVVVMLGTNPINPGHQALTETQFTKSVQDTINKTIRGNNPGARIFWVNAHKDDASAAYSGINAALAKQATSLGFTVIDWHGEVQAHHNRYEPFDISLVHPGNYAALADFIVRSVGKPDLTNLGEIGGRIEPTVDPKLRAYYAKQLPTTRTLNDRLSASGSMYMPIHDRSGFMFGWFNSKTSFDWRTSDSLAMRIFQNAGYRVSMEAGTHNGFASGVGSTAAPSETEESGLITVQPGQKFNWWLDYYPTNAPDGGPDHSYRYTIEYTDPTDPTKKIKETSAYATFNAHQLADGASFDRFGLFNLMRGGDAKTVYIDDLALDGQQYSFAKDPKWEASRNQVPSFSDCSSFGRHDFGWSDTKNAGGAQGEIGGTMWVGGKQAYYGDTTSKLTMNNRLYASGKIVLSSAHTDTDIPFIGWFNSNDLDWTKPEVKWCKPPPNENECKKTVPYKNLMVAQVGGTADEGIRLTPRYQSKEIPKFETNGNLTRNGSNYDKFRFAPMLTPKHVSRQFSICYEPTVDAAGNGRMTVWLSAEPGSNIPENQVSLLVRKDFKDKDAEFDRFGMTNINHGRGLTTTMFLDDLRYTTAPGDSGPADKCGPIDTAAPTVKVTAPTNETYISGNKFKVKADASDNKGVTGVQFIYGNNNKLGPEDTTAPYEAELDTTKFSEGTRFKLQADARDGVDNKASDSVNAIVDNKPPTISLTSPANNSSVSGSAVKISATAADTALAAVQFKQCDGAGNNCADIGAEDSSKPYEASWDSTKVANGSYKLLAEAKDKADNKSTTSIGVTVKNEGSSSAYEGKIIYGSDLRQYLIKNGRKQYITEPIISACIQVRRATGAPISVDDSVVNAITETKPSAWCYYEQEPGLNFVREEDAPTVWLVQTGGIKRHVGGLCANPNNLKKFKVFEVPAGETEGHSLGYHWFPTDHANACSELPG